MLSFEKDHRRNNRKWNKIRKPNAMQAHLTILKLTMNPKLMWEVKRIHPSLTLEYNNIELGHETVKSVQLCSMNGPKN